MSATPYPEFRSGTQLATSFTGTLTERQGERLERLPVPSRLADWLEEHGLGVGSCTREDLELARELREAIHHAASAVAVEKTPPAAAVRIINAASARGTAAAIYTAQGTLRWRLTRATPLDDALGVVAEDAIRLLSGDRDGRFALCASPTCQAAFFDASRSRSRRWCDMGTCGNREKKARFLANHQPGAPEGTGQATAPSTA